MKSSEMHVAIIMGFIFLVLILPHPASAASSQCIQCHTSKEKLQAVAKLIPGEKKSAEAEGTG